jgi:hypothetical protein
MIDGSQRVEFEDVQVLGMSDLLMMCQIGDQIVKVPSLQILPGTTISGHGDHGRLVLPRRVAIGLGLVPRSELKPTRPAILAHSSPN